MLFSNAAIFLQSFVSRWFHFSLPSSLYSSSQVTSSLFSLQLRLPCFLWRWDRSPFCNSIKKQNLYRVTAFKRINFQLFRSLSCDILRCIHILHLSILSLFSWYANIYICMSTESKDRCNSQDFSLV